MNRWLQTGSIKRKPTIEYEEAISEPTSLSSAGLRKIKTRKYSDDYLSFGFVRVGTEDEQKPQCVLCYKILSNESNEACKAANSFRDQPARFP